MPQRTYYYFPTIWLLCAASATTALVPTTRIPQHAKTHSMLFMTIVSPFDNNNNNNNSGDDESGPQVVATKPETAIGDGPFELTWENVDMVLEEMRPYV